MKISTGFKIPDDEYHNGGNTVQELCYERSDVMPNLSREQRVRRVVREAKYGLVNIKIAFKYMDNDVKRIYNPYIRFKLNYAAPT